MSTLAWWDHPSTLAKDVDGAVHGPRTRTRRAEPGFRDPTSGAEHPIDMRHARPTRRAELDSWLDSHMSTAPSSDGCPRSRFTRAIARYFASTPEPEVDSDSNATHPAKANPR